MNFTPFQRQAGHCIRERSKKATEAALACVAIEFQLCGPLVPSWISLDSFMISTSTTQTSSRARFNGFFQLQLNFSEVARRI
jgi:hypothetical protein